ncbi:hypothetical protein AB0L59_05675 [Streptomyces sp. NPDC052109]|jgi:hypothetical protein|uniref:hypothetical protein n=1 Tax=Streptomyces sp. NPDC052109 TaxID=3155527 RepID=UPI003421E557
MTRETNLSWWVLISYAHAGVSKLPTYESETREDGTVMVTCNFGPNEDFEAMKLVWHLVKKSGEAVTVTHKDGIVVQCAYPRHFGDPDAPH